MGTEDVEVTEGDGFQTVDAGEAAHVIFAGEFADRVRRNGVGRHVFALGEGGLVSVGGG